MNCKLLLTFFHGLTISASSDNLRGAITDPQATNTVNTIYYLLVGLYSVDWHVRHL